jgi:hypothetical protein
MHAIALVVLSLLANIFAYQVTFPNQSQDWTNVGNQTLRWNKVDTDPSNFTVVLNNQNTAAFPNGQYTQVLAALVPGDLGSVSVQPPSGGWVVATGYTVNLVKDPADLSSILAQSQQFAIVASNSTTTATGVTTAPPAGTTLVASPTTNDLNPTSSVYTGSSPNGALPAGNIPSGLLGVILFLGCFMVQF